jgi:hypothetical protein
MVCPAAQPDLEPAEGIAGLGDSTCWSSRAASSSRASGRRSGEPEPPAPGPRPGAARRPSAQARVGGRDLRWEDAVVDLLLPPPRPPVLERLLEPPVRCREQPHNGS